MKKISQFILLASLISGCANDKSKHKEVIFNRNDFNQTTALKSEQIKLEEGLNPSSFNVIKDTIILSLESKASKHFIQLYGLKSKKK